MPGSDDDECDGSGDSGKRGDVYDDEDESGVVLLFDVVS